MNNKRWGGHVIELITYTDNRAHIENVCPLLAVVFESEMISSAIGRDPDAHWNVHITSKGAETHSQCTLNGSLPLSLSIAFHSLSLARVPIDSGRRTGIIYTSFFCSRPSLGLNLCDNNIPAPSVPES